MQIKAKAWDETHKEWVDYGFCLRFDKDGNCEVLNAFAQPFTDRKLVPVLWTGLHDAKGQPIYDGDIVRSKEGMSWVYWDTSTCGWHLQSFSWHLPLCDARETEVIGNVQEHPDLIK